MPMKDDLGTRMKEFYEEIPKTKLIRRTPVAIRIDGKAFHTFTKGFQKPFDPYLIDAMQKTTEYLCKNIQGCVFGYTQSDEITLILVDYKQLDSDAWFDYEVQKLCSLSASMATMAFNKIFSENVKSLGDDIRQEYEADGEILWAETMKKYYLSYMTSIEKGAIFDARCFNIPKEEVCNLIYWRQLDAMRNSVQMVGQLYFSHSQLQGKSCKEIKDMLLIQKNINWDEYSPYLQRGTACIKISGPEENARPHWEIDKNMPILAGNRLYVERFIFC